LVEKTCPDTDHNPCSRERCEPASGACIRHVDWSCCTAAIVGDVCPDVGDDCHEPVCIIDDPWTGVGHCGSEPILGCCMVNDDCAHLNTVCKSYTCSHTTHQCVEHARVCPPSTEPCKTSKCIEPTGCVSVAIAGCSTSTSLAGVSAYQAANLLLAEYARAACIRMGCGLADGAVCVAATAKSSARRTSFEQQCIDVGCCRYHAV
jgi:hypothetical protein